LKFPEAEMIVIGGKIEGQPFIFNSQDAEEAMWRQEKLFSTAPNFKESRLF
jgi:hypothetical protein